MSTTHAGVAFAVAMLVFFALAIYSVLTPRNNWGYGAASFAAALVSLGLMLTQ